MTIKVTLDYADKPCNCDQPYPHEMTDECGDAHELCRKGLTPDEFKATHQPPKKKDPTLQGSELDRGAASHICKKCGKTLFHANEKHDCSSEENLRAEIKNLVITYDGRFKGSLTLDETVDKIIDRLTEVAKEWGKQEVLKKLDELEKGFGYFSYRNKIKDPRELIRNHRKHLEELE